MMTSSTFSALLAICAGNSPASGELPAQRPVTRSFDVFFDLCLNKRLRKQSWGQWFETLSRPLLRHCNDKEESDVEQLSSTIFSSYWCYYPEPLGPERHYCLENTLQVITCKILKRNEDLTAFKISGCTLRYLFVKNGRLKLSIYDIFYWILSCCYHANMLI